MVSPHLAKKREVNFSVDVDAKKLFQLIYIKKNNLEKNKQDEEKINVSVISSKMAFLYEKIRNAVDYDDEYVLRKNAIKRILKRQIFIEGIIKETKSENISVHLLTELIQAGYLSNNSVPEKKIQEISNILEKYIKLKDYSFQKNESFLSLLSESFSFKDKAKTSNKVKKILVNWIISLAATEIEESLSNDPVRKEIVNQMFESLKRSIKLPRDMNFQDDLEIQIYLSICRNFMNYDQDLLNLVVFKYYNKGWKTASDEMVFEISQKIDRLYLASLNQLKHPLIKQLDKITRKHSLYFSVLNETIEENPLKVYELAINNSVGFVDFARSIVKRRYAKIKKKLWSSGWRSIIYIFLTKSIFVFVLEIPAIKFLGKEIIYSALIINIIFPALLLFLIILFTRSPSKENEKKIMEGVEEIVFSEKKQNNQIILKNPIKRNLPVAIIFNTLYLIGFSLSSYLIIMGLIYIKFNWINIVIFLFFLAFVSFFSYRIRKDIKRFTIVESKDSALRYLFDFLYMPIVASGKFLSENASRVNIFVFILDFIIEAPFKVFIEIFDDWIKYIKERKEDLMK